MPRPHQKPTELEKTWMQDPMKSGSNVGSLSVDLSQDNCLMEGSEHAYQPVKLHDINE